MGRVVAELLFWLHVALILGAVLMGFVLPIYVVVALVLLHRLHLLLFGECMFSRIQKGFGALPRNMDFVQVAVRRFFKKNLTRTQSGIVDNALAASAIALSVVYSVLL